jgi:hypothetical protein
VPLAARVLSDAKRKTRKVEFSLESGKARALPGYPGVRIRPAVRARARAPPPTAADGPAED